MFYEISLLLIIYENAINNLRKRANVMCAQNYDIFLIKNIKVENSKTWSISEYIKWDKNWHKLKTKM